MQHKQLGGSGLKVSVIGHGTWGPYRTEDECSNASACVDAAYQSGVTFFDTANEYGGGRAEVVLGEALRQYPRSSYVVASKVFAPMGPGVNERGLSRKHILESIGASLSRLRLEYVDLYQCHRFDPSVPLEETCRTMHDLIRRGQVMYWGTSEWTGEHLREAAGVCEANGWDQPVSNQPQYSLIWRKPEKSVLPASRELGIGTLAWSPLAMGVLTGKYRDVDDVPVASRAAGPHSTFVRDLFGYFRNEVFDVVRELEALATDLGYTLPQLCLRWCIDRGDAASAIAGASRSAQVQANAVAGDLVVDRSVYAQMELLVERVLPME